MGEASAIIWVSDYCGKWWLCWKELIDGSKLHSTALVVLREMYIALKSLQRTFTY